MIAILAAITVVTYANVQNRAHDAAVQNDLRNFSTAVELQNLEADPIWTSRGNTLAALELLEWTATHSAYATDTPSNLAFCHNRTIRASTSESWGSDNTEGRTNWALIAMSKSGTAHYVTDQQASPAAYEGSAPMDFTQNAPCGIAISELGAAGFSGVYNGYANWDSQEEWRAWTM